MKYLCIALIPLLIVSCSTVRGTKQFSENRDKIEAEQIQIQEKKEEINNNDKQKKIQTSILVNGISHSLNQVTNPPVQVKTAQIINQRLQSIVGTPYLDEVKKIQETVDFLNSSLEEEKVKGQRLLEQRDILIIELQKEKTDLKEQFQEKINDLADTAKTMALSADENAATIKQMSGFFGLNAVFWGLKKFFFDCIMIIAVVGVIFIILRLLAASNPVAAAAFSIFDMLASFVINIFKALTPKAFEISKLSNAKETYKIKELLNIVINTLQKFKERQKDNPSKTFSMTEIFNDLNSEMDKEEKNMVQDILRELKWKR